MRVAQLISHMDVGGPPAVVRSLTTSLKQLGVDVTVVTLHCDPSDPDRCRREDERACLHLRPGLGNFRPTMSAFKEFLRTSKPDVVHSHGFVPDVLNARFTRPSVSTVHNIQQIDYANVYGRFQGGLLSFIHREVLKHIDHPVACSIAVRNSLPTGIRSRAHVVHNGVDVASSARLLSLDRGHQDDHVNYLAVGSLTEAKGIDVLCTLFSAHRMSNEFLLVAGEGPLGDTLSSARLPGVHVLGRRDDLETLRAESCFYVSNSKTEGFPMAALEAISGGLIPLLSDIPAHRELMDRLPVGALFERDDIGGMLAKARSMQHLGLSRDRLIDAHASQFTSKHMAEKYLGLYREALGLTR